MEQEARKAGPVQRLTTTTAPFNASVGGDMQSDPFTDSYARTGCAPDATADYYEVSFGSPPQASQNPFPWLPQPDLFAVYIVPHASSWSASATYSVQLMNCAGNPVAERVVSTTPTATVVQLLFNQSVVRPTPVSLPQQGFIWTPWAGARIPQYVRINASTARPPGQNCL